MKFALLLLLPLFAQANTIESVYRADSSLPRELKERVLSQVLAKCPGGVIRFGLKEDRTTVRVESVDQGIRDSIFTTTFHTTYYFDGMHPTFAYITVESAEYDIANPSVDRFDVRSIKADAADVCK